MISIDVKNRIVAALSAERHQKFTSDSKHAVSHGISPAQYSRIIKGDFENVLSDAKWITLARRLDVQLSSAPAWITAKTPTFSYIFGQLQFCQENSTGGMLCDSTSIGKTYTAKCYVKESKHTIYIDCSQVKSKRALVMQIAKEFGISTTGIYRETYADLVYYLKSIEKPLIILDEAGDLDYSAFLELKALYNATDQCCGWYMMGADALRKKIEKNREKYKVGYHEIFSRYGSRYQKVSPDGKEAVRDFRMLQATLIAKANGADDELLTQIKRASEGIDLRRIYIDINKKRKSA